MNNETQVLISAMLDNMKAINKQLDAMIEREELIARNMKDLVERMEEYVAKD